MRKQEAMESASDPTAELNQGRATDEQSCSSSKDVSSKQGMGLEERVMIRVLAGEGKYRGKDRPQMPMPRATKRARVTIDSRGPQGRKKIKPNLLLVSPAHSDVSRERSATKVEVKSLPVSKESKHSKRKATTEQPVQNKVDTIEVHIRSNEGAEQDEHLLEQVTRTLEADQGVQKELVEVLEQKQRLAGSPNGSTDKDKIVQIRRQESCQKAEPKKKQQQPPAPRADAVKLPKEQVQHRDSKILERKLSNPPVPASVEVGESERDSLLEEADEATPETPPQRMRQVYENDNLETPRKKQSASQESTALKDKYSMTPSETGELTGEAALEQSYQPKPTVNQPVLPTSLNKTVSEKEAPPPIQSKTEPSPNVNVPKVQIKPEPKPSNPFLAHAEPRQTLTLESLIQGYKPAATVQQAAVPSLSMFFPQPLAVQRVEMQLEEQPPYQAPSHAPSFQPTPQFYQQQPYPQPYSQQSHQFHNQPVNTFDGFDFSSKYQTPCYQPQQYYPVTPVPQSMNFIAQNNTTFGISPAVTDMFRSSSSNKKEQESLFSNPDPVNSYTTRPHKKLELAFSKKHKERVF